MGQDPGMPTIKSLIIDPDQNEPDAYDPGMEPILWYIVCLDFANFYNYDLYYPFV